MSFVLQSVSICVVIFHGYDTIVITNYSTEMKHACSSLGCEVGICVFAVHDALHARVISSFRSDLSLPLSSSIRCKYFHRIFGTLSSPFSIDFHIACILS